MTTMVDTLEKVTNAQKLAKKQELDPSLDYYEREEAVAEVLRKAGAAISPKNKSPRSVLSALETLENLAHIENNLVQRIWLAIRALDLKQGEIVGGSHIENNLVQVILNANGAVATLDKEERVSAIIGDLSDRGEETLAPRTRMVEPGILGAGFAISQDETVLFEEGNNTAPMMDILKSIDNIETRHSQKSGKGNGKSGPTVVTYSVIQPENDSSLGGETLFENYSPRRMKIDNAKEHPTPLVESAALASVLPPTPNYQPMIPQEVVTRGILSDVQLETITYAGQAHENYLLSDPMDPNGTPPRQGFLVGHGTGVGKGRIIAGIIADNWGHGRRRAVWVIERHRHINDGTADWLALGGKKSDIIDMKDVPLSDEIPARNGILFVTYSMLRGENENKNRVEQIINWLGLTSDNPIVFDESQNMRNAVVKLDKFGRGKPSKQGAAGLKLQNALPNARITYASATSASDIISLGYAVRLGLWGKGTAFPTAEAFFGQMEAGGINALELVARDLKALGLYLATNLSFDGVDYERLEYKLTSQERSVQDDLAEAWAEVNIALQSALTSTGIATLSKNAGRSISALANAQFGMARSRFFQALLASIKTKVVIESIRDDMKKGYSSVVQMTNTYEANADRALSEVKTGDLSLVEATPKDILIEYIQKQFPTQKYSVKKFGKQVVANPMTHANGQPVICPVAEAKKDALIKKIQGLNMPEGPLEQMFAAFGSEAIAEVTGRTKRLVPGDLPGTRKIEQRGPKDSENDIKSFQNGLKNILVFSTSGAAGSSYHADRTCANKSLRRHYLLQAGWRADHAIQGLGRTHRSNEAQPPVYILVTTDLWSDRRMISSIASGMQKLGAITRGQRHAASQDLFTESDNLESAMASDAWHLFLQDLEANKIPNLSLAQFERDSGIPIRRPGTNQLASEIPEVRRFLNAMSGMKCNLQESFGMAYKSRLDSVRLEAIRNGTYDRGIETLTPESLIKLEDTIIYRDPRTNAPTRLLKMLRRDAVDPVDYTTAQRHAIRSGNSQFVKSSLTNRIACLCFPRLQNTSPTDDDKITVITPTGIRQKTRKEVVRERWALVTAIESEDLWQAELSQPAEDEEKLFYVVSGTLLPLWDKMPKKRATVYRMETDEGERILGRTLPEDWVKNFTTTMNALNGQAIDPLEALEKIEKGNIATLANGWTVEGRVNQITGKSRVEIVINDENAEDYVTELEADGVYVDKSPLTNKPRFRLPEAGSKREKTWMAITQYRPVVGMTQIFA